MLLKSFDWMCPLKRILTSSVVGLSRGNIYLSAFNKEMLQFFFVFNFKFCKSAFWGKKGNNAFFC